MSTMIIAEAGVNHNGDLSTAYRLIDYAVDSGADVVKFQLFDPSSMVSTQAKMAEYQQKNTGKQESQLNMLKKLTLSPEDHKKLMQYCQQKGIIYNATPFDLNSIDVLLNLGVTFLKIPSGEITNLPYLIKIASSGLPVILSTGMCEMHEVKSAVEVLISNGSGPLSLLHCNTEYPTPYEDVNLNAMLALRNQFHLPVGYSDHTLGIEIPIAAVALGAQIIEKHFTLDKNMEGPDHKASLDPTELQQMVQAIRHIEKALGNGCKIPTESEKKNIEIARKSIVAARNIRRGEIFSDQNLTTKRPGNGLSPMKWFDLIGKSATKDYVPDEPIEL